MKPEVVALILGLAGIVATLISSGLGLYFIARARTAPMRELLYARQLALSLSILHLVGRMRVLVILMAPDGEQKERAREDFGRAVHRMSVLSDQAAVLFPAQVFGVVRSLSSRAAAFLVEWNEGRAPGGYGEELSGQSLKLALMARTLLGIEELSDESVGLFTKKRHLQELAEIGDEDLLHLSHRTAKPSE
jgi:hypothetical protein